MSILHLLSMVRKTTGLLMVMLCAWGSTANASNTYTFFGKVLKVDGHNVMHVGVNGEYRYFSFAYIMTPVKDEPYAKETSEFIRSQLQGQWLQFTQVAYGRTSRVRPVVVRMKDQTAFNATLIKQGYAVVNPPTDPPAVLVDQQITAQRAQKGLWQYEDTFDRLRSVKGTYAQLQGSDWLNVFEHMENTETPIRGFLLVESSKKAYELYCMMSGQHYDSVTYSLHAVEHRGYALQDGCDLATASTKFVDAVKRARAIQSQAGTASNDASVSTSETSSSSSTQQKPQ